MIPENMYYEYTVNGTFYGNVVVRRMVTTIATRYATKQKEEQDQHDLTYQMELALNCL